MSKILFILSRSSIILIIFFILMEITVRIFIPRNPNFVIAHHDLGIAFLPNARSHFVASEGCTGWETDVSINSHGLKDKEYDYQKPANTFRILVLGDSFTDALQFPDQFSYPTRLEKQLNELSDGVSYEVINAGRSGTGEVWQYIYYLREGYKYNPDLVLQLFIPNNFGDNNPKLNLNRQPYLQIAEDETFTIDNSFRETGMYQLRRITDPLRVSLFVNTIMDYVNWQFIKEDRRIGSAGLDSERVIGKLSDIEQESIDITHTATRAIRDIVESHEGRFILLIGSAQEQVNYSQLSIDENYPFSDTETIMSEFAIRENIDYLNLVPILREYSINNETLIHGCSENGGTGHWSPAGHEIAANAILDYLSSQFD